MSPIIRVVTVVAIASHSTDVRVSYIGIYSSISNNGCILSMISLVGLFSHFRIQIGVNLVIVILVVKASSSHHAVLVKDFKPW